MSLWVRNWGRKSGGGEESGKKGVKPTLIHTLYVPGTFYYLENKETEVECDAIYINKPSKLCTSMWTYVCM